MTKNELQRGNELKKMMDSLDKKLEKLEEMEKLCSKNMDIEKQNTHDFSVTAVDAERGGKDVYVCVTPKAAYRAVCEDIKDIKKQIDILDKQFAEL